MKEMSNAERVLSRFEGKSVGARLRRNGAGSTASALR